MILIKRIFFSFLITLFFFFIYLSIFKPIYIADNILFSFAVHPFNICKEQPLLWNIIKLFSLIFCFSSQFILSFSISQKILIEKIKKEENAKTSFSSNELFLLIGSNDKNDYIAIPKKSLYQNILITGTIGTGKTSSAMYPFTRQLMEYKSNNAKEKLGMLILDVKGNYHLQVKKYAEQYQRYQDLIVLDLSGNIKYNPLHKPNL